MAFSVSDFRRLLELLEQHPELRGEFFRLLLGEELSALADAQRKTEEALARLATRVEELAEAQRRTEARLEALAARVEELAEAQRRTEERLEGLAARVEELAEAQRRTEARLEALAARVEELADAQRRTEARLEALAARVEELAEAQRRTEERLQELAEAQRRTEIRIGELSEAQRRTDEKLASLAARLEELARVVAELVGAMVVVQRDLAEVKGIVLEDRYRRHAAAYFRPLLRRIRVVPDTELAELVEDAEERGLISEEELQEALGSDLVVTGRRPEDRKEAVLAAEISWVVDGRDVERAARRAAILGRVTGKPWIAAVAGRAMSDVAAERARALGVRPLLDGVSAA
ncbi:MAG: hypothetical protein KatS3mg076_1975 [Candidatus Binatia bacterium]|nr:MAG: hypothetical protein KatS3mg076_1975 [Candidatus Binatia bacterium]